MIIENKFEFPTKDQDIVYDVRDVAEGRFTIEGIWNQRWMKIQDLQGKQLTTNDDITLQILNKENSTAQEVLDLFNVVGRDWRWGAEEFYDNDEAFWEGFVGDIKDGGCMDVILSVNGEQKSVGFIQYEVHHEDNNVHIPFFGLKTEWQNKKIGPKMMDKFLEYIKQLGFKSVTLFTDNQDSTWAYRYYVNCGYEHLNSQVYTAKVCIQDKIKQ